MPSVAAGAARALPTDLVPLPRLLAYAQALGLERYLARPKRGIPTLVLALVWLVLAWRGSGRPYHVGHLQEPLLAALLGTGVPFILGFARSRPSRARLAALSPQQRRWLRHGGAVRLGPCPWDERLRLFALGARSPTDRRGPWVYLTSLRQAGPQFLAYTYRQRWRVEQALDELVNGHDLDHPVSYRLHPTRLAIGFRLLARNPAIGLRYAEAAARPTPIREPLAGRVAQVEGLGTFTVERHTIVLHPLRARPAARLPLPWTRRVVRLAA
jgi:hypothetical protein